MGELLRPKFWQSEDRAPDTEVRAPAWVPILISLSAAAIFWMVIIWAVRRWL